MANQRFSKKILNICIICIIIVAIIFTAVMLILNYDEKGETNMPFKVSKISIVSTVNGQDVENSEAKWDINVIQNNDVYIYIEKNDDYKKQETIKNVKLENITIAEKPEVGEIKIYKPISNDSVLFENKDVRQSMGRNSRKLAEKDFSIDDVIKKHLDIYRTLVIGTL